MKDIGEYEGERMSAAKTSDERTRKVLKIVMVILLLTAIVLAILLWRGTGKETKDSFRDLIAANPDVVAWLTVDGTEIDTVVTQAENNTKYISTDVYGEQSITGTPFLDYRNSPEFVDHYSIIYGHNVQNHMMFSDLKLFTDEEFWKEKRTGTLELKNGKKYNIEFFAYIEAKESEGKYFDPRMVENNWTLEGKTNKKFLAGLTKDAAIAKDKIKGSDRILVLSTCEAAGVEDRILVMGRILK